MNHFKNISILTAVGIGDIIALGPILKKLSVLYPEAKITIISFGGGFLEKAKIHFVDQIIKPKSFSSFLGLFQQKCDLLIGWGPVSQLKGFKSIIYWLLARIFPARTKIIYTQTDMVQLKNKTIPEIRLEILKKLGVSLSPEDYKLFVPYDYDPEDPAVWDLTREIRRSFAKLIVIHPGAQARYPNKLWKTENWIKLIDSILKEYRQTAIFLIGAEPEATLSQDIVSAVDHNRVQNLTGQLNLEKTTALIAQADYFISTNSGPMWIAAACEKPQVVLSGPSKLEWDPYNKNAVVIRKLLDRKHCNPPCNANFCYYRDNLCMIKIDAEIVFESCKQMMR